MEQVFIVESVVEWLWLVLVGILWVSVFILFGVSVIVFLIVIFLQVWFVVWVELDLINWMVDLVDEGFDLVICIGEIYQEDLVVCYLVLYWMVICVVLVYLVCYGIFGMLEDFVDYFCLFYMVWIVCNEWWLLGVEGEVCWKCDVVLCCNDGYVLCQVVIVGVGLLMQLEVLLVDVLVSGSLVCVLEVWILQLWFVYLFWCQDCWFLLKLMQFIVYFQQGMVDVLIMICVLE